MSLADIVPMIQETRIERRKLTKTEIHMRWLNKPGNRAKFNAYRRQWWRKRKTA